MADKQSLQELGLGSEALQGDAAFDQIPENLGQQFADPFQPGVYRFQFPVFQITSPLWSKIETQEYGDRIAAAFEDDLSLIVVQSPGNSHNGEAYRWRVSNVPRPRTKEKILISDMAAFLRGVGVTKTPKNNAEFAKVLAGFSGKQFTATQEFSWFCNDKKPMYIDDGAGGTQEHPDGKLGCGARYYQRDVQKVEGEWPVRINCGNPECGASVRAFGNLTAFKP